MNVLKLQYTLFVKVIFIGVFVLPSLLLAQKTSTRSGNWNTGSTWVGGVVPASTDEVVIATGHTVTVTANATCCNYYIQSGATLSINSGITLSCVPTACTNVGIAAADGYDNKGTISGSGTFYINANSTYGSTPTYENNGTISVSNLTLNNSMTNAFGEGFTFANGQDAAGSITSTNLTIRNTSGYIIQLNNDLSSTINSTNITIENLYTSSAGYATINLYNGSLTATNLYLNNSSTSMGYVYLDNYATATLANLSTTNSSGNQQFYYGENGATLNYSGASVATGVMLDVDDAANTVNFNSNSATQALPVPKDYLSGATSTYYNLTLNNTYSTYPQFTMSADINAVNALTLTSGIVNMNGYRFTLGSTSGFSGTLSRSSGHFYSGTFRRYFTSGSSITIGNIAGLFPLGTSYYSPGSTAFYRPFWLGATSITTSTNLYMDVAHTFTLPPTYTAVSHSDATWSGGTTLQGVSNSYWTSSRTFNTTARSIRFGGEGYGTPTLTDINGGQASSSAVGTHSAATNSAVAVEANRTLSSSASIDNSWYIGTKNKTQSPLPVELKNFSVTCNNNIASISWTTATETNNDFFTLERSTDGILFEEVHRVQGYGNTVTQQNYNFVEELNAQDQKYYYRLKQTDYDGQTKIISLETTACNASAGDIQIVSLNQAGDQVKLLCLTAASGNMYTLYVHDQLGRLVAREEFTAENRFHEIHLRLNEKSASYVVSLHHPTGVVAKLMILQ